MKYAHVARWFYTEPWAILPAKLAAMSDALTFLASGGEYTAEEIAQIVGATRPATRTSNAIAVLPMHGVISHRAGMLSESSGGTSTERFALQFRQFLNDPNVGSILLDVDSPGGSVSGVDELSAEIYQARGRKPIVAHVNAMAASAAYWIATAADEVVVTPSGEVGSIGVFAAHQDLSAAYEREGVKTTLISAGKYKVEGNPYEPLTDEARAAIQERVSDYYSMFVAAVARNRGVSASEVRGGFGEGRMVGAKQAKALNMADRVDTYEATLERLAGGHYRRPARSASLETAERRLRLASMSG
jgi:signal peptide peptidase SppA